MGKVHARSMWLVGTQLKPRNPMPKAALLNRLESRTLSEFRDALLPKLLSGELWVPIASRKETVPHA